MTLDKQITYMDQKIKIDQNIFKHVTKSEEYLAPNKAILVSLKQLNELRRTNEILMESLESIKTAAYPDKILVGMAEKALESINNQV